MRGLEYLYAGKRAMQPTRFSGYALRVLIYQCHHSEAPVTVAAIARGHGGPAVESNH